MCSPLMELAKDPPGPENVDKKCFRAEYEVKIFGQEWAHADRSNPSNFEHGGLRFEACSGETSLWWVCFLSMMEHTDRGLNCRCQVEIG